MIESWQAMTAAQQDDLSNVYANIGEQAASQFRERLDNVSNQWMLATVTSFDHQSRDSVTRVTADAEEKLRETFTKVFADMGDALRDRMRQIAANLSIPPPSQAHAAESSHAASASGNAQAADTTETKTEFE